MITQEYLKSLFEYREGKFFWKTRKSDRIRVGVEAGTKCKDGRIGVRIDGKNYRIHRLIYLYHHGYLPNLIDHVDGNNQNNLIENLRPATISQNGQNRTKQKNNSSGYKGVYFHKKTKKWVAYCDGKCLGYFDRVEDASEIASKYRIVNHNEFAKD